MKLQGKNRLAVRGAVCLQKPENTNRTCSLRNRCAKYISVSRKLLLRSRGSRLATSYYLLIHFEQAAYARSSLFISSESTRLHRVYQASPPEK